ncbi:uncharacterized protein LOC127266191 [Andrographis paniculata]|uniref:uncharacterized protein LOC127266191 n=1 Tax=Andrographis paniculata TaxID=175694 RepID=UPI0021E85BBB|nr:uncharacterized protein LOC127266191 [Andrographis paniculata]XP_051152313.1 uncharacterized protein LOC127266191 [Andrographis paniculata]
MENPTSRLLGQQPSKDNPTHGPQIMLSSTVNKGGPSASDEFKYGFPSAGLSSVSMRWWGNKGAPKNKDQQNGREDAKETKQQRVDEDDKETKQESVDEDDKENKQQRVDEDDEQTKQQCNESLDDAAKLSQENEDESECKTNETDAATRWASLRKKAAEEGRRALKLGVYRGYNAKTLDKAKKMVLLQIFKTSVGD